MFLSVFEIFKIGVGPSSSHTSGPMVSGARFRARLGRLKLKPAHIKVQLFGALALTGKGHGTNRAVMLGLMGWRPETLDPDVVDAEIDLLVRKKKARIRMR